MTASIDYLPIWKKNSTAEEWLLELASIARKNPERFERAIIMMEENLPAEKCRHRYFYRGNDLVHILGIIRIIENELINDMVSQCGHF